MASDKTQWQLYDSGNGEIIRWHPILTLTFDNAPNRTLGIANDYKWVAEWFNGKLEKLNSRDDCINILVCLQKDRSEFEMQLKSSVLKNGFDAKTSETFPVVELIKFALKSETPWAADAISWLRQEDIDVELEELLTKFIENKQFTQPVRHRAFKILKNWQKH